MDENGKKNPFMFFLDLSLLRERHNMYLSLGYLFANGGGCVEWTVTQKSTDTSFLNFVKFSFVSTSLGTSLPDFRSCKPHG